MDGLFIDSEALYKTLFFNLLSEEGVEAADAHFLKLIGLGWDEAVATLQSDFPDLAVPEFITRWKAECDPRAGHVPDLKPGADVLMDVIGPARPAGGACHWVTTGNRLWLYGSSRYERAL